MQELFAPPIGLEEEIEIQGQKFYSSDKLKEKFLLAFKKSSRGKPVYPQVEDLVQKKFLLPCFQTKGVLKFITKKLSGNRENKYTLAFYHIPTKIVIVLIDNSMTIFGTAANDELASTTMHECMHLVAGRSLTKFLRIFYKQLRDYYEAMLTDYFELENVKSNDIADFLKFISKFETRGPMYANNKLTNYFNFLKKTFITYTKLDEKEFNDRLVKYIVALKLFLVSPDALVRSARKFSMVFSSLNRGYEIAFGERNTYTFPIQELISMSEVACVLSEMKPTHPAIKKLFKAIA